MTEYKVNKLHNSTEALLNSALVNSKVCPYIVLTTSTESIIYNCIRDKTVPKGYVLISGPVRRLLSTAFGDPIILAPVDSKLLDKLSHLQCNVSNVKHGIPTPDVVRRALLGKYVSSKLKYCVEEFGKAIQFSVSADGIVGKDTVVSTGIGNPTEHFEPTPLQKWDLSNVGGLKQECNSIFRRAFVSRVFGPEFTSKTGMDHVKGIILHGPPGCGKTLIARELSKLITSVVPKLVNGPELLNKYVGESEANVRRLFKDAENEYKLRGDSSNIHVIIFDEFDSLARKRGSTTTLVYDGVVNQILTMMDGKEKLNNIIVVALTNRLDLLDEALLRPGRFEVHIEIGLPSQVDRREIFDIHLKELETNKSLVNIDRDELVVQMTNFTGAEIASVVRNAVSYATSSMVEIQGTNIVKSEKPIRIQQEDFIDAIDDVTPRFGKKYFQLPELWPHLVDESDQLLKSLRMLDQSFKRVAITGKSGTGKTTFAKYASQQLGFDCIRYTSDHDLIGATEQVKLQELREMYEDCLKCSEAVLIIDNLEIILGYNPFLRYVSNNLFQLLKTILSNNSKANELIIIVTVADESFLEKLQLLDYIDCAINLVRPLDVRLTAH